MEIHQARLAEYTSLRQEIIQSIQLNVQATVIALPIAAGLVAYGFQSSSAVTFLAVVIILFSCKLYTTLNTATMISIGAYIVAIIETKMNGLEYETMIFENRRINNARPFSTLNITSAIVYNMISLGCVFFTWKFLQDRSIINLAVYGCLSLVLVISLLIVSILSIRVSSTKYFLDQVRKWWEIENEVSSVLRASHKANSK